MKHTRVAVLIVCAICTGMSGCSRSSEIPMPCGLPVEILPQSIRSKGSMILVIPIWTVMPRFYTGTEDLDCELYLPFVVSSPDRVPAGLKRPDSWGFVTPAFRVGSEARILSGIYLVSRSGDVVWLRASISVDFKWSYIKVGSLGSRWKKSLLASLAGKEIATKGESDSEFFGADYGLYFKLRIILSESEKRMVEKFIEGVSVDGESAADKWKRLSD